VAAGAPISELVAFLTARHCAMNASIRKQAEAYDKITILDARLSMWAFVVSRRQGAWYAQTIKTDAIIDAMNAVLEKIFELSTCLKFSDTHEFYFDPDAISTFSPKPHPTHLANSSCRPTHLANSSCRLLILLVFLW
jgi:hypothetical protein